MSYCSRLLDTLRTSGRDSLAGSTHPRPRAEAGYALLFYIVFMVIAGSIAFGLIGKKYALNFFYLHQDAVQQKLLAIKNKLLDTALVSPETYLLTDGDPATSSAIPGPGYFPCPDTDGDGQLTGAETSCGNTVTGFVEGELPREIASRNLYYNPVWDGTFTVHYVVDERFVINNKCYITRFFPINSEMKVAGTFPTPVGTSNCTGIAQGNPAPAPSLSLNGRSGYVMLLIYPGEDGALATENLDGDSNFQSGQGGDDVVVGITFSEWAERMRHRVCRERGHWRQIDAKIRHWYNEYNSDTSSPNYNPVGQDWRFIIDNDSICGS